LNQNKAKRQLLIFCFSFGLMVISGSIQIILSPFPFVRGISVLTVIGCSATIGAFIREMFILNEKNKATK